MYRRIDLDPYSLWEHRSGSGTPVVLVHGLSASLTWWRRNIPALEREHEVAAVDLVGFGRSRRWTLPTFLPTFDAAAAILARWIEQSFDEPVHLVGHSMGGQLSIHLAARRPELVRSLVLVNSTGIPFLMNPLPHLRHARDAPAGLMSFGRVLAWDFLRAGPVTVAAAALRLLLDDARPEMRQVDCPTLLVWGDHDPVVPDEYAADMRREIPQARLVEFPRSGHIPMWAVPDAFNETLLQFFREVERGDATRRPRGSSSVGAISWSEGARNGGIYARRSGPAPAIVLVHGLGVSGAYFEPLARALHSLGIESIAPDLPGFGRSENARPLSPREQAERLVTWADELVLPPLVWLGHSTGCDVVQQLSLLAPERSRGEIYLSPIWNGWRHPTLKLALSFALDIPREPLALVPHVARDYWRAGLLRWFRTMRRHVGRSAEVHRLRPGSRVLFGRDDPMIDAVRLATIWSPLITLPGAHAVNFSHPFDVAEAVGEFCARHESG